MCLANSYYLCTSPSFHRFINPGGNGTIGALARPFGAPRAFFDDPGPTVGTGWDASRHRGDIAAQTSAGDPESLPAKGARSDGRGLQRFATAP